jgi:hypothetical protein
MAGLRKESLRLDSVGDGFIRVTEFQGTHLSEVETNADRS